MSEIKQRAPRMMWCLGLAGLLLAAGSGQAQVLQNAVQVQGTINQDAARSQQRVNTVAQETEELLGEFRRVVRETDSLRTYNEQLQRVVEGQRVELSAIDRQLAALEETNREIIPLLLQMIEMLGQITEADVPFRIEERRTRVAGLRDIIDRADVTTSEKYRRVMEAYQVELEYGRTADSYEAEIDGRLVDFLRVGRTVLVYQTKDGASTGWWNPATRSFENLGAEYRTSVRDGLRVAKGQAAPDLVRLPVPAPQRLQ